MDIKNHIINDVCYECTPTETFMNVNYTEIITFLDNLLGLNKSKINTKRTMEIVLGNFSSFLEKYKNNDDQYNLNVLEKSIDVFIWLGSSKSLYSKYHNILHP
jgi:hypothetical protein